MSQQIQITGGAKVRNLEGVLTGTSGVVNALGINVPDGIPQLDGSGKILVSQLPNSVMEYKGTWDASTNTPTLADGTGNAGDVYLCNVAGTVDFGDGPITFAVGDQVLYSGTTWEKASGATGTVTSVGVSRDGDALTITGSPITTSGTINIGFSGGNGQYINGEGDLVTFPSLSGFVTDVTGTAPIVSSGGTTPAISIPAASSTVDGYLDNADWTTFNNKQDAITLTTTGTSGVSTLVGSTLNIPNYSTDLSGYVPYTGATTNVNLGTHSLTAADLVINHTSGSGVAASITKGGSGEALTVVKSSGSGNAASITGGVTLLDELHLNTDLADAYIASAATWNAKQNAITLTTTGTSGAATLVGATLNIPQYQGVLTNPVTGTGTTNTLPKFTGASTIGNSNITDTGSLITLGSNTYVNGALGIGTTSLTPYSLRISKNITGGVTAYGMMIDSSVQSNVTSGATAYSTNLSTQAASFTTTLNHYQAIQGTIGAGSAVSVQVGFNVGSTLVGATTNYGFFGNIPSGTNRWNLYMQGTANNYMAGGLGIGATSLGQYSLKVAKNISGAVTSYAISNEGAIQSGVTSNGIYYNSVSYTAAASFTIGNIVHYFAQQGTFGAGSTVTRQYGFFVASTLIGGTNNYGFYGDIASGTNRWNIYMNGTANNYLAGSLGIGSTSLTGHTLRLGANLTGLTTSYGIYQGGIIQSGVTTQANYNATVATTANATFTLSSLVHYNANQGTFGASSTVTNQYGFAVGSNVIGATNNYGFFGNIPSGTNRWNLYMAGTAANYLAGKLLIGSTTDGGATFQVTGTATISSSLTANSLVKSGGTSSQFLMADGSVSTGSFGDYLPLTGGTMSGGFSITNANNTYSTPLDTNVPNIYIYNSNDASTTAHSILTLRTRLGTGGNPFVSWDISGVTGYSMGIDNADSDKLKIAATWNSLSTSTILTFTTTGAATFASTITASNFSGSSSGTNTGDQTLAGLGGLPLTGGTLTGRLTINVTNNYGVLMNRPAVSNYVGLLYSTNSNSNWFVGLRETGTSNYIVYNEALGTDAINITSTNSNVLIGTTTDSGHKLDVNGSSNISANNFYRYNGDTGIIGSATAITGGANTQLGIRAASDILFATNGANERMRITSAGWVGFNTSSPNRHYVFSNPANRGAEGFEINAKDGIITFLSYNRATSAYLPISLSEGTSNVLIGTTTDNGHKLQVNGLIYGTGRMLLGTTSSASQVEINGGSDTYGGGNGHLKITSSSTGQTVLNISNTSVPRSWEFAVGGSASGIGAGVFYIYDNTAGQQRMVIGTNGVATFAQQVYAQGFYESSDKRLKKEISDNPIIDNIEIIKPKLYLKDGKEEFGYYAQELEQVLPSSVTEGMDGFLSLSYSQVHTAKIAHLEAEVAELKELIKTLL
jgi:hypothetical protein